MGRRSADNQIDWELIEKEYRLGQFSLRQLAATHKVQASAISRKAKAQAWVQDKRHEVKARSEAQLLLSAAHKASEKATPTADDIETAATVRTNLVLAHRTDLGRGRALTMKLLSELEHQTDHAELFEKIADILAKQGEGEELAVPARAKLNEALQRAISLAGRTSTMKALADALQKLIACEREAFGIGGAEDDKPPGEGAIAGAIVAGFDGLRAAFLKRSGARA